MARILSIDYGGKRTGLAVTDPLQIIATGLETIDSRELIAWLKKYLLQEQVELIIIGLPKNWDESDTHGTPLVEAAIKKIDDRYHEIKKDLAAKVWHQLRSIPVLKFFQDDTLDHVFKMEEIFKKIEQEKPPTPKGE